MRGLGSDSYGRSHRFEPEHADFDLPLPGCQIESITAVLVGVSHQLGAALTCRDGSAGNDLVGCTNRPAVLGRHKQAWRQEKNREENTHCETL